jgi:hypothetical protein
MKDTVSTVELMSLALLSARIERWFSGKPVLSVAPGFVLDSERAVQSLQVKRRYVWRRRRIGSLR